MYLVRLLYLIAYVLSLSTSIQRCCRKAATDSVRSYSPDQYTSTAFLTDRSFEQHALQATINTITSVFQAMSQPPIAKFADVFGRVKAYVGCFIFYVIGYIIVAHRRMASWCTLWATRSIFWVSPIV